MMDGDRAALYVRVSTDEQAEQGYSLDAQLEMLRAYCESMDMQIAGEYIDDGYSGRNTKRPAYNLLFTPEERMKWDSLVVLKMDRVHRNSKNFMTMIEDLAKHNQSFISTTERIDTKSAIGRFAMDVIQRIAQLESEQIGERTKMGMIQKAEQNDGIMGFNAPFGYSISDGKLVKNADEMQIVRLIFNYYSSGMTLNQIADKLNDDCLFTRNENLWNKYNLRNILHNPVYAGYMRWEDNRIIHDAGTVISPEEFNEIQERMASRTRNPNRRVPKLLVN